MQNVEIFIGSPRKNGNTNSLADIFIEGLDASRFSLNKEFLYDYEINACTDCRACKKGKMECVVKDGMNELYPRLDKADIIVFGSPIYWSGPTAKTKLLLDRLRPYYSTNKLKGKKAAIILAAGDGESDCDLTIEMFSRAFKALGIELIGSVSAKAYDIGESEKDKKAIDSIAKLLNEINSLQ